MRERVWHAPKRDLITGLQLMLERRELGLPSRLPAARDLAKEIAGMGVTGQRARPGEL